MTDKPKTLDEAFTQCHQWGPTAKPDGPDSYKEIKEVLDVYARRFLPDHAKPTQCFGGNPIVKSCSILTEAEEIVNGSRNSDYGDSNQNLTNIATIAKALGVDIDGAGICKVMIAVKLGREMFKHKRDNLVDACGYLEMLNRWEDKH